MPERIQPGDTVRHFKGNLYYVIETNVLHSETQERMVLYRSEDGSIWVRPYDMFTSEVDKKKYPNVMQTYRFETINTFRK